MSDFSPPWWLRNAHLQTIFGRLTRPRRLVMTTREVLTTPDGDELVLDHLQSLSNSAAQPRHFVLMHGLEGSSNSVYIQGLLAAIKKRGADATAINFRSCARDPQRVGRMLPNRRPRFYHSGETTDFDFVIHTLAARAPHTTFLAVGASLGGNALLKWLGQHPHQTLVTAAATLSVPYDLGAGGLHLEQSFMGRFYVKSFLATLKRKVDDVVKRFPDTPVDLARTHASRTFREFDDAATAPLHGFRDADDYYDSSSSVYFLPKIATPTLCISAEDDPFVPREALERARAAASKYVQFETTKFGGHTGFISGKVPWRATYWAEERVVDWLLNRASEIQNSKCKMEKSLAGAQF
jgi:predicted alpha/beta-fold hydrolase